MDFFLHYFSRLNVKDMYGSTILTTRSETSVVVCRQYSGSDVASISFHNGAIMGLLSGKGSAKWSPSNINDILPASIS